MNKVQTLGMGTFSPSEIYTEELANKVKETVLEKTLEGFKKMDLILKVFYLLVL